MRHPAILYPDGSINLLPPDTPLADLFEQAVADDINQTDPRQFVKVAIVDVVIVQALPRPIKDAPPATIEALQTKLADMREALQSLLAVAIWDADADASDRGEFDAACSRAAALIYDKERGDA